MERIKEAIKLAKSRQESATPVVQAPRPRNDAPVVNRQLPAAEPPQPETTPTLRVDRSLLEENRIVAHLIDSPVNVPYDILRTKVTQEMDQKGWKVLVITSPTSGCGKTVTSINLALSNSKLPGRSVVLLHLDLRKPSIAKYLGVHPQEDLTSFLEGRATPDEVMTHIDLAGPQLIFIGNNSSVKNPSEALGSQMMTSLLERLRDLPEQPIIIVDMPPVLFSDDVIAFIPQSDCCLLTVQENETTRREIESSEDLLAATNVLGCVLNKSHERTETYYY